MNSHFVKRREEQEEKRRKRKREEAKPRGESSRGKGENPYYYGCVWYAMGSKMLGVI